MGRSPGPWAESAGGTGLSESAGWRAHYPDGESDAAQDADVAAFRAWA